MSHARFALAGALLCAFVAAAPADEHEDKTVDVSKWPKASQKAYQEMKGKYGEPDGVTPTRLVWTNKAPFLEIILLAAEYDHQFPKPHKDCLEHIVAYDVPVEKVGELAKFDGSIIIDRTRGVLSARCDSEAHNILALNLADDIIRDKKSVEEARKAYGEAAKMEMKGKKPPTAMRLQFKPVPLAQAGDPDVATVGPQAGEAQPAGAEESADPQDRPEQLEREETQQPQEEEPQSGEGQN